MESLQETNKGLFYTMVSISQGKFVSSGYMCVCVRAYVCVCVHVCVRVHVCVHACA